MIKINWHRLFLKLFKLILIPMYNLAKLRVLRKVMP